VQDWVAKLRQPSEQDSKDLRGIYLDNANVVGITCVQAANYNFSEEFQSFDVVIIDEVSKCTPPELLIPALKGKKLVMVGDHKQLPPMLDTSTVEEVAQTMGNTREELQFLEESLFKSQFETADKSIRKMLNTQYRMHPMIMGAINQFYHGKLECGILEPDTKRAHNLAGEIIQPYHHLIWVNIPREKEFQEERNGTSFFNTKEIDVIESICQQFENVWVDKVANGEARKEIAVITFYGAQLRKIDERLQSELFPSLQIRTGTVDRFQGMERPVVIVSMVRNNHQGDVGFANKPERVNVAFSRAQELLVIVGCHDLFTSKPGLVGTMYSEVANTVNHHGGFIDVSCFSS
jgi:superfamily I DNA and/or RNA helicase